MNSFSFFSENAPISLSLLNGIFDGYKFLDWQNIEDILLYSVCDACFWEVSSYKDHLSFFSLAASKIFQSALVFCSFTMLCVFLLFILSGIYYTWFYDCVSLVLESVLNIICPIFSLLSSWDPWLSEHMSEIFTLSILFLILLYFLSFFFFVWSAFWIMPSDPSLSLLTFYSVVFNMMSAEFLI